MSGRERALSDLLGTKIPPIAEDYPDTISLPTYIHSKTLASVRKTGGDNRERSLHFRHRFGEWTGGLAVRGPRPRFTEGGKLDVARINWVHQNSTIFYPPHVHAHTHPKAPVVPLEQYMDISPESLTQETRSWMNDTSRRAHALDARIASSGDVYRMLKDPLASIAQLVAAQSGTFLLVHRDASTTKAMRPNNFSKDYKDRLAHAREMQQITEENEQFNFMIDEPLDFEQLTASVLATRAWALRTTYICYATDDVENPRLSRIDIPDSAPPKFAQST